MLADDGLPPLRDVISEHGLAAKKSLGQNFLLDLNLTGKIARTAGNLSDVDVIEVGPGPGGLTRALLSHGAKRVIVIERDARCLDALNRISEHYPGKLVIVEGDALETDFSKLTSNPYKVVANLPYNVATPLLVGWMSGTRWPPQFLSLTLMFQKEVAQRICASPGEKHYGRLGVLCGWRAECSRVFDVPPQAFTPPPKVTSSIVQITPRLHPANCGVRSLETITRAAFGQRRKMLRSSLKAYGGESLLNGCGVDPTSRAEELSIESFVRLANGLPE